MPLLCSTLTNATLTTTCASGLDSCLSSHMAETRQRHFAGQNIGEVSLILKDLCH